MDKGVRIMKKVFLIFLMLSSVITFFFFSPILALILGLCCIILGLISLVNPALMKSKKLQHSTSVRVLGCLLLIVGLVVGYGGGSFTYQLYLNNDRDNAYASSETGGTPETTGTGVTRPMSNPDNQSDSSSSTTKTTEKSTGFDELLRAMKETISPEEPERKEENTPDTKPAPTSSDETSSPDEDSDLSHPKENSHKEDPPKEGEQGKEARENANKKRME